MSKEKIDKIAVFYYSRKDVQESILKFCQDRETVPRYYEGFGKRPDTLQYPQDIIQQVKNGATSFHCSEELWTDPLTISTDMNKEQLDKIRKGWDLLADIDCKWFDYSKKAASAIIQSLKFHGIKNIGIKFSGNKGFHIIIPWKSFPEEINMTKTSEMFPEWPRIICEYLKEISRPILERDILESGTEHLKLNSLKGVKCENCGNISEALKEITYYCGRCRIGETIKIKKQENPEKTEERKCSQCRKIMTKKDESEFYMCRKCQLDSKKNPKNFSLTLSLDIYQILGLDLTLVSSRHLFRTPYSLHEKTGFASIVISEDELKNFNPKDADPLKVKIKNFYPKVNPEEARELLIQALDWSNSRLLEQDKNKEGKKIYEKIKIDKSSIILPPSINKILQGMKDGRKRALFILINFFKYLDFTAEELEQKINDWNKKNEKPLKIGYIKSQLDWAYRNKKMLPPNYDKPYYKDIGITPDEEEIRAKNPVAYVIKKSRWLKKN